MVETNKTKQAGVVVWFTGLSGAGKTTIAYELHSLLMANNVFSYILDGDVLRDGLSSDLTFDTKDRIENLRRIKYVAGMFSDANIVTLVAVIFPFRAERDKVRSFLNEKYVEVYVKIPFKVAEQRDSKGLYKKARKGLIKHFTGVNSPYEDPHNPELVLETERLSASECALKVFDYLRARKYIK